MIHLMLNYAYKKEFLLFFLNFDKFLRMISINQFSRTFKSEDNHGNSKFDPTKVFFSVF